MEYSLDATPPRPPDLSELAETGERARERMQTQRVAGQLARARREPDVRTVFRAVATVVVILSVLVLGSFLNGEGQCAVPAYRSLSLSGAPMLLDPGLCAVDSVVPVWLVAVTGMLSGLSYLLWTRPRRTHPVEDPPGR